MKLLSSFAFVSCLCFGHAWLRGKSLAEKEMSLSAESLV